MSSRAQRDKGQKQNTAQTILSELLKEEDNRYCSDCKAKGPRWASWNLGVFLCIRCAGIHRNLGVHISRVKSVNLDSWTTEQLESIQEWGNKRAAEFWECNLPSDFRRPQTDSATEHFIRNKYERKKYLKNDGLPPSNPGKNSVPKEVKPAEKTKKKKERREEEISITPLRNGTDKKAPPSVNSTPQTIAQPRPSSHPPAVKAPEQAKPAALVDLLSLDTPTTASASSGDLLNSFAQPPPASQPAKTGLENELIDFGAFQQNTIIDTGFSQPQQLNSTAPQESNEESLLKDDSTTNKSTKDSIMALYAPKSQNNQPQMYNVPGGVYITPQQHQQQPRPAAPTMFNRMGSMPVHGVSMGMGPQLGNPHQQVVMQQRQQQQQQQVAQIQQQMQQMRLKQQLGPQQMTMQSGAGLFGSGQPAMANGWMPSQQPMSFPQQQHPQFVTTGPAPPSMNYGGFPMATMPGSGQTLSNQLWK